MGESFSILIKEWLASTVGDPVEKATNAELAIVIAGNCVTQVEDFDSRTVRSTIRVSAEPLAKWLLANWWRLRWEAEPLFFRENLDWAMSHSTAAVGGGYVWPDLIFTGSDGSHLSVVCKTHLSVTAEEFSPIRFLNSFYAGIPAADFEAGTRSFVQKVIARLESVDIRKSELHDLWADLAAEWKNPKLSSYRKMEALLGLDPDENDALTSSALKWGRRFGHSALEEISAVSKSDDILEVLSEASVVAKSVKTYADLPNVQSASLAQTAHSTDYLPPWQLAQSLAYALRQSWDLDNSPISDSVLADRLSLPEAKLRETRPSAPFSFGYKGSAGEKLGFVLNREHDHGRRFDLARLIGDYISIESDDRIMPVTIGSTVRQKFQRAFAAEFLCPSAKLKDRYPKGVDQRSIGKVLDEISSEYNVAERVVLHHMENREVLSQEFLEPPSSLLFA